MLYRDFEDDSTSGEFNERAKRARNPERIIFLTGPVNDRMANAIINELLLLEAEDPNKAIKMYINSSGGSVMAGLAVYDTMMYIKAPVHTIGIGMCASMALKLGLVDKILSPRDPKARDAQFKTVMGVNALESEEIGEHSPKGMRVAKKLIEEREAWLAAQKQPGVVVQFPASQP